MFEKADLIDGLQVGGDGLVDPLVALRRLSHGGHTSLL
jgi:hypothetical protein